MSPPTGVALLQCFVAIQCRLGLVRRSTTSSLRSLYILTSLNLRAAFTSCWVVRRDQTNFDDTLWSLPGWGIKVNAVQCAQ